ncbi:MAG: PqqD family protein [Desulfobacterales bacterium]|nr:PqqD family protein [Desulfobacterales bacterium]
MDKRINMVSSRRGFIGTFLGLLPGIMLLNPGRLQAAKPGIQNILGQMELETLIASRPERNPSLRCHNFDDTNTLCRLKGGEEEPVGRINTVGKMIWEACDGKKRPKEISKMIHDRYPVSKGRAWTDTLFFLSRLKKIGAIL